MCVKSPISQKERKKVTKIFRKDIFILSLGETLQNEKKESTPAARAVIVASDSCEREERINSPYLMRRKEGNDTKLLGKERRKERCSRT